MLVVMNVNATGEQIEEVCEQIRRVGLAPHPIPGSERTAIGITGNMELIAAEQIEQMPGVLKVIHVTKPYKLVGRECKPEDTVVKLNGLTIGGEELVVMAGPCAVESKTQLLEIAHAVKEAGAVVLRGGAFKPRTSPYSFQGLGERGLEILAQAREETGLLIITEATDPDNLYVVSQYADIIQVGARNMQNFALLTRIGKSKKPVLLKRGISATIEEFLMAAEYILSEGNYNVILCERGVRTFNNYTRFTLDISTIPEVKRISHLPIIVDPSHGTGRYKMVSPMAKASIAAGADGIIVEVHCNPKEALSDGAQSLTPENFIQLMDELEQISTAVGRKIAQLSHEKIGHGYHHPTGAQN
jgi:3-deoxy-7-phosphoheptulonate synthase